MKTIVMMLMVSAVAFAVELKYDDGGYEDWGPDMQISGVWFDANDFVADSSDSFDLDRVDIWFGDAPWATDSAHVVIRAVDPETGFPLSGAPIYNAWITANPSGVTSLNFSPAITVPTCFAVLEYGRSSAEPAPRIAFDTTEAEGHSVYQQWGWSSGSWAIDSNGNYAIRCYGEGLQDLESTTWAGIKAQWQ